MSLSPAPLGDAVAGAQGPGPGVALAIASGLALLGYVWVGLLRARAGEDRATTRPPLRSVPPMAMAWCAQFVALFIDISGYGLAAPGARFGFAPALSMTTWLVLTVYLVESRFLPLHSVRRVLAWLAAAAVLLAWTFPGESRPTAASPWAPLHWVLGLASYGLFGVAVLHAALLNRAESQLRRKQPTPGGLPLLQLERLTFQFVAAGVGVLSLAILLGWWFTPQWHWDHKNLLAVLGWLVLTGLLVGRRIYGWRGRRATRWLYAGAGLLLLSYAGSRFVLEVVLQRGVNGGGG
ncbi:MULTISPECIES: cytochrome C assembly family protein [Roseateles]|uniref:Cytochrome c biogenesis protein CcsA n=1 Tax=Pelomonas caseinilytica TaxID=2906763 RepID=A0ABS8XD90_9BURK|nr:MULTISPECIES: cytochrome c biogenesis protein CcsA [unclassified Roseateles]MCE4537695.1 cytochrome c biogenesis protein CcsA [Pelomonas sp. P7]HEV6964692.1 cytochrome c biogenesis protein CcsA [Roseateles sp.]